AEGDEVKLKSVGRPALVRRSLDGDQFEVEIGAMKMKISRDDIAEVLIRSSDSPVKAARARGISVSLESDLNTPSEINVIGRTVDDATREVEKFVDRAFLAGLPRVRVVRSEEHTSELQSRGHLVCRLLLEKKNRSTDRRR